MKNRIDFINHVIKTMDYKTYLEVGVYQGEVFNTIQINKTGVDNDCDLPDVLNMTSDEFFEGNTNLYDIIFVDGDHNYEQVKKDVQNALECLTPNGMVLMHDTCPTKLSHVQPKKFEGQEWCGQAYEVAAEYNQTQGFDIVTWNKDFGVTVIVKNENNNAYPLDYDIYFSNLIRYNHEMVNAQNIGTINEFLSTYKSNESQESTETIPLKEYYKLCLPENRIGRKSDKTLIAELKEAGFEI